MSDDHTQAAMSADEQGDEPTDHRPEHEHDEEFGNRLDDAQHAIEGARRRLLDAPAEIVITNHAMGLYELAAVHLGAPSPDLSQAALSIDALACVVEGLGDRLGPEAATMRDALANIRLAFVQIKSSRA